MIFYGLLDRQIQEIVELFASPVDAERFIEECLADEPGWETILSVELVGFETSMN